MPKVIRPTFKLEIDDDLLNRLHKDEIIKALVNTDHYFITSKGRVFSGKKIILYELLNGQELYCVAWKELRPRMTNGYLSVTIDGKREYVHKLVFETYHHSVNQRVLKIVHLDGDKLNNKPNNLAVVWRNKRDTSAHEQYLWQQRMLKTL